MGFKKNHTYSDDDQLDDNRTIKENTLREGFNFLKLSNELDINFAL